MSAPLQGWIATMLAVTALCASAAESRDPAEDLYKRAERSVVEGNQTQAITRFRALVRTYPKSTFAAQAQLQIAELFARNREYLEAFEACQRVIEKFPTTGDFTRALELQFLIAERVLQEYRVRKKNGDKSTQGLPDREAASGMWRVIVANGVFSAHAPKAQFRLASTLDEEGKGREAVHEFNVFIEKYPKHPLADDAAFQAGLVDYRFCREQNHERGAQQRALLAFEYFLIRYPGSEKVPEAKHLIGLLSGWEAERLEHAGGFYAKTADTDAALMTLGQALTTASTPEQADILKKKIEATFEKSNNSPRPR